MTDLVIDPTKVREIEVIEQFTGPAAEAIGAGQYVRLNTTTGKIEKGNATTAAEARKGGLALNSAVQANDTITFLRKGIIWLGDALDALNFDADVLLSDTDGTLADVAGTVSLVVGTIVPLYGQSAYRRGLRVDL